LLLELELESLEFGQKSRKRLFSSPLGSLSSCGMDLLVASYKNRRKSPCGAETVGLRVCFDVLRVFERRRRVSDRLE
jgi:hypothetical protein